MVTLNGRVWVPRRRRTDAPQGLRLGSGVARADAFGDALAPRWGWTQGTPGTPDARGLRSGVAMRFARGSEGKNTVRTVPLGPLEASPERPAGLTAPKHRKLDRLTRGRTMLQHWAYPKITTRSDWVGPLPPTAGSHHAKCPAHRPRERQAECRAPASLPGPSRHVRTPGKARPSANIFSMSSVFQHGA
jgi:hypothetical protein